MNNKVSCIIIHHTGRLINHCLKSLEGMDIEKIIVTSDMKWKTKDTTVRVLYSKLNEPAFKRNVGALWAQGRYLCFLDDDIEVTNNCIKKMSGILDNNKYIGMVYATLYKMDNHEIIDTSGSFLSWGGFLYETYIKRNILITPILSSKSACCIIRKHIFFRAGAFDDDYVIYGEETDLSWRVWQLGYKVVIRNSAIAYHASETSFKPQSYYNPYFIHYHGCKNYITNLLKNLPPERLYIALLNTGIWFTMACFMLFSNRQASKWILQGIWYNIKNFGYIWNKRRNPVSHNYWKLVNKNPPINYYFGRFKGYITHKLHNQKEG